MVSESRNALAQWLIPAAISLMVIIGTLAVHFGYNTNRLNHIESEVASVVLDLSDIESKQDTLSFQLLDRLARIEVRQEYIIEALARLDGGR